MGEDIPKNNNNIMLSSKYTQAYTKIVASLEDIKAQLCQGQFHSREYANMMHCLEPHANSVNTTYEPLATYI